MYRNEVVHVIVISWVSYAIMVVVPRKRQHVWVLVFVTVYNAGMQIYNMWKDYGGWRLEVTAATMPLVCKLNALSFAYKDGVTNRKKMTEYKIKKQVIFMPTFLEYNAYVCCCAGMLIGPWHEFKDFKDWIDFKGVFKDMPTRSLIPIW